MCKIQNTEAIMFPVTVNEVQELASDQEETDT